MGCWILKSTETVVLTARPVSWSVTVPLCQPGSRLLGSSETRSPACGHATEGLRSIQSAGVAANHWPPFETASVATRMVLVPASAESRTSDGTTTMIPPPPPPPPPPSPASLGGVRNFLIFHPFTRHPP